MYISKVKTETSSVTNDDGTVTTTTTETVELSEEYSDVTENDKKYTAEVRCKIRARALVYTLVDSERLVISEDAYEAQTTTTTTEASAS